MKARVRRLILVTAWFTTWPLVFASEVGQGATRQKGATQGSSDARPLRLPDTPFRYTDLNLPVHFRQPAAQKFDNTPADNPTTDAGATLGRVLLYDTRLSANNTISCASCHVQAHAFVDPNRFSRGFEG